MEHIELHNNTFKEKLALFKKKLKQKGYSPASLSSMPNAVKEMLYWMEQRDYNELELIDQELVDEYFNYLEYRPNLRRNGGLSVDHLNKCANAILRFVEMIKKKPKGYSGITKSYKRPRKAPKEILTQEEVIMIFNILEDNVYYYTTKAIVACCYGLGLRVGEVHRLNLTDIDYVAMEVVVKKTKNRKQRIVPMNDFIAEILEEYTCRKRILMAPINREEPAVILSTRGTRMAIETLEFRVEQAIEIVGIEKHVTPHIFRHSIGTHLLMNGLSVNEVKEFMGHSTLDSLMHYMHWVQKLKNNG